MGEASGRNLIAALIRDRATAMAVGWQIEINHVESESTSSRAYEIMSKLGCADFIAIIEQLVGQILAANEKPDDARQVLRRSAEMFRKLGRDGDAKEVDDLIRQLGLA